jgi:membrane associated rhomboid family serine protease
MREPVATPQLPRPGPVVMTAMGLIVAVWVGFALALNFFGVSEASFLALAASSEAILRGELWRLLTAGILERPIGPGAAWNLVITVLGLYFFGPALERAWGARRMALFLAGSVVFGFATQFAVERLLPAGLSNLGQERWFGAMGAVEAVAVAWALGNRDKTVALMFVLPVGATGLLLFVIGLSVLRVIAAEKIPEGLFTPFGGMIAGYLFGAGTPSPARRMLLRVRYAWMTRRAAALRAKGAKLRVIDGGEARKRREPPSDKRFLN